MCVTLGQKSVSYTQVIFALRFAAVTVAVITQPLILGQAIKTARRAQGLTQVALADEVGTYPRVIIDIERGRSTADLRLILAITTRLALTVSVDSP